MSKQMTGLIVSPLFWLLLTLAGLVLLTAVGPAERSLGTNVRVVYLHGVWVWTALVAFAAAGVTGLLGLVTQRSNLQFWSRALGRTGLLFWVTYLPISMWAMESNWNGLFLAEPRFRLAVIFSVAGLLLQLGVTLLEDPLWASGANLLFVVVLFYALRSTQDVMHPPSPIMDSESRLIQFYFGGLLLLTLLIAWQVTRWLVRLDRSSFAEYEHSEMKAVNR